MDSWNSASEKVLADHFPLHRACRDGDLDAVQKIVDNFTSVHGADVINSGLSAEDSFYGWTPIHYAAYFGHLACLRKLLTLSTFVSLEIHTNHFRQTPCHLASFGGSVQCLKWLLDSNASAHAQDYIGETPAHKAARSSSIECLSLLIAHGANLSSKNNAGQTPIDVAEMCNQKPCAEYLRHMLLLQQQQQQQQQNKFLPTTTDAFVEETNALREPVVVNGSYGFQPMLTNGVGIVDGPILEDVLMNKGVSFNLTPVAGRKRAREDDLGCPTGFVSEKRLKTTDCCWMPTTTLPAHQQQASVFSFVVSTSKPFGCSF